MDFFNKHSLIYFVCVVVASITAWNENMWRYVIIIAMVVVANILGNAEGYERSGKRIDSMIETLRKDKCTHH